MQNGKPDVFLVMFGSGWSVLCRWRIFQLSQCIICHRKKCFIQYVWQSYIQHAFLSVAATVRSRKTRVCLSAFDSSSVCQHWFGLWFQRTISYCTSSFFNFPKRQLCYIHISDVPLWKLKKLHVKSFFFTSGGKTCEMTITKNSIKLFFFFMMFLFLCKKKLFSAVTQTGFQVIRWFSWDEDVTHIHATTVHTFIENNVHYGQLKLWL